MLSGIGRTGLTLIAVTACTIAVAASTTVAYPDGYRGWTHVKSMVIHPGHALADRFAGIHHVYANGKALDGMSSGTFGKGAVLVFDLLEYEEADEALVEGGRKFVGVMEYDAKAFAATGGWGFEAFAGDSKTERVVSDGGQSCFDCHTSAEASNYVFASYRK